MRTMRGIVRLTVAATVLAMFVANGGIPAGHPVLAPIRLVDREAPLQPFTVPGILAVDPPDYRRAVDQYMAIFGDADHLKFTKTLPYVIYVMSAKDPADTDLDHPWEMTTGCLDTDQVRGRKPPASVVMKVYPGGLTARSDEWNIMVAHEAFHAMSCAMSKAATDFYQLTPWVQEGMAEWAAKDVTGNADYEKFSEYVGTPARSLFDRDYDAVGFYAQLRQSGTNPYDVYPAMMAATSKDRLNNSAIFDAAAPTKKFLDSWASGFFLNASLGPDWDIPAFVANSGQPRAGFPQRFDLGAGGMRSLTAPAYAVAIGYMTSSAPIVHVQSQNARVHDTAQYEKTGHLDEYLCTDRSRQCVCPPGETYDGPALTQSTNNLYVAVTGQRKEITVDLTGIDLDKFCNKTPAKPVRGQVPATCPPSTTIALGAPGDWEYVSAVLPPSALPPGTVSCGYDTPPPQSMQTMEVFLEPAVEPMEAGAETVDIPGAERAWRWDSALYAVVNGRTLIVTSQGVIGEPEKTVRDVAQAILGTA